MRYQLDIGAQRAQSTSQLRALTLLVLFIHAHCLCAAKSLSQSEKHDGKRNAPIVIVYENDVHCAVDGYSKFTWIRDREKEVTPYVTTVSCGDFIQGGLIGSVSRGRDIVRIMDKVGYDVVTLGNHEFDYGVSALRELTGQMAASTVCANFRNVKTGSPVFQPYKLVSYGKTKVAYIGFTTTNTMSLTASYTFMGTDGTPEYDFSNAVFYQAAQRAVDAARSQGADYVVTLAHLGNGYQGGAPSSEDLIKNVKGLDVVLDGHDHNTIADTLVSDKEGHYVHLSSTGTKFQNAGILTIGPSGKIQTRLVPLDTAKGRNEEIQAFVDSIKADIQQYGSRLAGFSKTDLLAEDASGRRLVRCEETSIGDLCCDAFKELLGTDIALLNGGGIRSNILKGEVSINQLRQVFPFSDTICKATITGQELLDALEYSVAALPAESGSFLQVSGMKFEVDTSIPSPVTIDGNGFFGLIRNRARRVKNVVIMDRRTGVYLPVDKESTYTTASIDYLLRKGGSGGILRAARPLDAEPTLDVDALERYVSQALDGDISGTYNATDGRITIYHTEE